MIAARSNAPNTRGWMHGASAPQRGALLGLLLERPGHGYDLANRLVSRLGETWRIDPRDVYRLLETLEKEGLASGVEEARHGEDGRTLTVYHPTAQTAGALTAWMETLIPRKPVRLDLQAKLAVAREQDVPRLLLALRQYERECLQLAQQVAPRDGQAPCLAALFVDCTRDSVHGVLEAEIAWASRTRRRIDEYAAPRR
jgi:DNA-binding PadR family transcriptional regulator